MPRRFYGFQAFRRNAQQTPTGGFPRPAKRRSRLMGGIGEPAYGGFPKRDWAPPNKLI
jgi:hypothetical protein